MLAIQGAVVMGTGREKRAIILSSEQQRERLYVVDKCQSNVIHICVVQAGSLMSLSCTVAPKYIWTHETLKHSKNMNVTALN